MIPDVSVVQGDNLVAIAPDGLVDLDKNVFFVEVSMKPYTINNTNGISFTLISAIAFGKATIDSIPSPAKRALTEILEARKRTKD
jgi:hypothetical protein